MSLHVRPATDAPTPTPPASGPTVDRRHGWANERSESRLRTSDTGTPAGNPRWTFHVPTPLGMTRSTYEFADDGLHFLSDDVMGVSATLPWSSIDRGCTAATAVGGRGAPNQANWVPAQLEWLLLSRTAGSGKAFMRALPQGDDRDAIVAALRARLGAGWVGMRLPLSQAQSELGIREGTWVALKVAGIVVAVLALLMLLLMTLALLAHPLILLPAGFALGGWLCRSGLAGLRDGLAVANTPTARAGSAALGLVELEGRAISAEASAAGISGRPSVWWDVSVYLEYEDGERNLHWRPVASRHGGRIDLVEIEDNSGRLPVWLPGATLLFGTRRWESGKDELPAPGQALLEELGFPWGSARILVTEECVENNQTLYVLGTLDERRNLREACEAGWGERTAQSIRSGQWRRVVVGAVPVPLRIVVAVLIGFLDLVTMGRGGDRSERDIVGEPPAMAPSALAIWKGRSGRPFVVSNQPESAALSALRRRSLWTFGIGVGVMCYALYELVELWVGK